MAAADHASTLEECQGHLDRAVRLAQLACMERRRPNVVDIGLARRDRQPA